MSEDFDLQDDCETRLDQVVASYLAELGSDVTSGAGPDITSVRRTWLVRHPEFFDELSDFFSDSDQLEHIAAPLRQIAGKSDDDLTLLGLDPPLHPEHLGRLGDYEVTDLLGQGGMGVVFKAFDETLNRHVAIKLMAPQWSADAAARRRFAREAKAAAAISHPHVVTIHAVGEWRGRSYLVMEYISGTSLEQRIRERGPLELKEILWIGSQVASGLAAAHAQGLIHRDVKPGNIMLENDLPRVKLTDFGLARAVDDVRLTQQGILAGTPQYMAPEQARGEPLDRRTDLFSLGSVLYALCTGRPAFVGESTVEVIHRVCDATPARIQELNPDIPDWLAEIVERLHRKDPADRFQNSGEVAELLERHLARSQDRSLPPVEHDWVRRPARSTWAAAIVRVARSRWAASIFLMMLGAAVTFELMHFSMPAPVAEREAAVDPDQDGRGESPPKGAAPGKEIAASTGKETVASASKDEKRHAPLREYVARFDKALDARHVRLHGGSPGKSSITANGRGVTIVAGPDGRSPFVELLFAINGDFEITASYTVPVEKQAEKDASIGPSLQVFGDPSAGAHSSLTRPLRASRSPVEAIYQKKSDTSFVGSAELDPTRATSGKLRVTRTRSTLVFSIADGTNDSFREVARGEVRDCVCQGIRLSSVVTGGSAPRSLIWQGAAIRAAELLDVTDESRQKQLASRAARPEPPRWNPSQLDASRLSRSYEQSFLDKGYDFRALRITAPGGATNLVRPDRRGVRITIPKNLGETIAIETKFGIHGDFDLRATYEVLACQTPAVGFGVGPELLVKPPGDWDKLASLSRFARQHDVVYSAAVVKTIDGQKQIDGSWPATNAVKGTLRLVRIGATVHYLVAEGDSQDFHEINQGNLGSEDLEMARISVVTGGSSSAVDVLWKDLNIRAEGLPGLLGGSPAANRFAWWIPALGAITLAIAVACLWLRAVASRRAPKPAKPEPAPDIAPAADWDDAALSRLEEHAAAFAESHPDASAYVERPRFQFGLKGGVLHGPFVVWAPLENAAMKRLGANWEEVCEKLPRRFEGAYRNGKRNGGFLYRNGSGKPVARRYRDGDLVE